MYKLNTACYAPEEDEGSSGSGSDLETSSAVDDVLENDDDEGVITEVGEESSDDNSENTPSSNSAKPEAKPDSVAELVAQLKRQADAADEEKANRLRTSNKQPSQDEIEASLGRVKLTSEDLASLGFLDADEKQVAAFQKFADRLMDYAQKKADAIAREHLSRASADYEPIRNEYLARQQEKTRNDFYAANPNLKGKEDLVAIVAKTLPTTDSKGNPLPPSTLFANLASEVNRLLTKAGINTSAKPEPKSQAPKPNSLGSSGGSTETKKTTNSPRDIQAAAAMRILRD